MFVNNYSGLDAKNNFLSKRNPLYRDNKAALSFLRNNGKSVCPSTENLQAYFLSKSAISFGSADNQIIVPECRKSVVLKPANGIYLENGGLNPEYAIAAPGVAVDPKTGDTHFLYTAKGWLSYDNINSMLGYAVSHDGKTVDQKSQTQKFYIYPTQLGYGGVWKNGFEDPRITHIDGTYYVVANALDFNQIDHKLHAPENKDKKIQGAHIVLLTTPDLSKSESYKFVGEIGPYYYDKNAMIFPKKITKDGQEYFGLIHRNFPNIQMALVKNLEDIATKPYAEFDGTDKYKQKAQNRKDFWNKEEKQMEEHTILKPIFEWEGVGNVKQQIAGGAPPVEVSYTDNKGQNKKGWLFTYNAVSKFDKTTGDALDRLIGIALLDYDNPYKILARSPKPIIVPSEPDETRDITFATGATIKNNELNIYYTAGDKYLKTASFSLNEMLNYLTKYDDKGQTVKN